MQTKIIGGIYDDSFLVKPVKSAMKSMPAAGCEVPYEGAEEMLLVDAVGSKEYLSAMCAELSTPKRRKTNNPRLL